MNLLAEINGIKQVGFSKCSAVYFLCLKGEIVYVGKTLNLAARIGVHATDKEFDSVFYIETIKKDLAALERSFIRKFKPPLNGVRQARQSSSEFVGITIRLPIDAVIWLQEEKERSGVPKERLVLSALLSMYPIRTR